MFLICLGVVAQISATASIVRRTGMEVGRGAMLDPQGPQRAPLPEGRLRLRFGGGAPRVLYGRTFARSKLAKSRENRPGSVRL